MSSLLKRIVWQARTTFDRRNHQIFTKNFQSLKEMAEKLNFLDLGLEFDDLVSKRAFSMPEKAPCTFISVYECDDFTLTVFILNEGYTMPLHDHPKMNGILKAIHGIVRVQCFSKVEATEALESPVLRVGSRIPVRAEPAKMLGVDTEAAVLTPAEGNFHEITAVGGIAAFFDILSPPYEDRVGGKRKCSFFRKVLDEDGAQMFLEKIPTPLSYYCDSVRVVWNPDGGQEAEVD